MSVRPTAVIDIDGVVADVRHRLRFVESRPKDWEAFFAAATDDPALAEGVTRVIELAVEHDVVFVTGRPERCRRQTETWLTNAGIGGWPVIMRRDGDRRPAAVVVDDPDVCAALAAAGRSSTLTNRQPMPRACVFVP